ncbi:glycosyltransferase family 39 protein [Candidatus Micrarchaeota archaeon]|nr:glycosyltransferase family 39 protein [Candidatus Micrarchaeota archaeon]
MKNEEKLALAFILLLSFSLSAYSVTSLHMRNINSYSELLLAKDAVAGKLSSPTPLLYQLTAFVYSILNSGSTGFNAELMLTIAKILPIIFSLLCVALFYFMLRSMFSEIAAVGGTVLLVSSLPFIMAMGSGFYTADALGMCLFTAACSAFFLFHKSRNYLLLLASALLFFMSGMSWETGWVMIGVVLLSLLAQLAYSWGKKFDEPLAHGAAAVLVTFLLAYFIFPQGNVFSDMKTTNLLAYTSSIPLAVVGIFAFISWLIGKHRRRSEFGVFAASFFILSVVVLLFHYFPAALGIALFSAFAINELLELKNENLALMLFAGTLFFVSFLFSVNFLDTNQSIIASAGVALTSVFIASLYRERRIVVYITFSVIALFLFSSLIAAMISASQRQDIVGSGADEVISWTADNLPDNATVWAFRVSPLLEFTTGRRGYSNDTEFARFILSNDSAAFLKSRNVTHMLVDTSLFDSIGTLKVLANNTRVRIASFIFYGRGMSGGSLYGIFVSADGEVAYVQLDPITSNPVAGSVRVVTKEGNMRVVPIENFLSAGSGRLVYPQDNYKVNLFNLFFGQVGGLKQVYASSGGDIKIYEVVD